jgi:hypothetical protein
MSYNALGKYIGKSGKTRKSGNKSVKNKGKNQENQGMLY